MNRLPKTNNECRFRDECEVPFKNECEVQFKDECDVPKTNVRFHSKTNVRFHSKTIEFPLMKSECTGAVLKFALSRVWWPLLGFRLGAAVKCCQHRVALFLWTVLKSKPVQMLMNLPYRWGRAGLARPKVFLSQAAPTWPPANTVYRTSFATPTA